MTAMQDGFLVFRLCIRLYIDTGVDLYTTRMLLSRVSRSVSELIPPTRFFEMGSCAALSNKHMHLAEHCGEI